MRIGIDIMGGDTAPLALIEGVALAHKKYPELNFVLVGNQDLIKNDLKNFSLLDNPMIELVNSTQVVEMKDSPTAPLRSKKDSSISVVTNLMKAGKVDAIVSAGHTGAAVASSVVRMRTLKGIERPGIATVFPTPTGSFVLLDAGANVDSKLKHLVQYALMGEVYAKSILGRKNPRIGLLNIGGEAEKGNELTKETFKILSSMSINFIGNVEGKDLFLNKVDVVVCDGFVGNIVLKSCEGLAKAFSSILKDLMKKSPLRLLGAFLSRNAFKELKQLSDADEHGGAPLLGINGTCIIAHGASSPRAIMNAIRVAKEFIESNLNHSIESRCVELGVDKI